MYIKVEVLAGSKKEIILKNSTDSYTLSVREKAEQNQANRRVIEIMRGEFGDKGVIIKLVSGHHNSHKILSIDLVDGE